jgi:UDP-N-acetylglucosamine 2-epimerase (non-hydrolysing)
MAPVAHALAARGVCTALILTGQHPQLDPGDFGLDLYPQTRLGCAGEEDPHAHVCKVTAALLPVLTQRPDLLMVQGDTSSALGAALAGFAANIPVAHVEAGLRSHDPRLPWPEEEYRTAIDRGAALLFAPTEISAANLRRENVGGEIHVTGNSGIDALLAAVARLPPASVHDRGAPILLVTCHRRESWSEGLQSIAAALVELGRERIHIDVVLHPNRHVAQRMTGLLGGAEGISLIPPCTHHELLVRMRDADLILSDSGGIQEEAPALGVPLLVLREKTERPEGVTSGNMRLVGTSTEVIVAEARRLLGNPGELFAMSRRAFPYGDGHAAPRIAAIAEHWLELKHAARTQRIA